MALLKTKITDIPKDAVVLSETEALEYEWKIIKGWKDIGDVWPLRYAPGILGGLSAISGIAINQFYRRKLKLGRYGHLSTYLPIVILPAVTTAFFHNIFIQRAVILNPNVCPVCIEVRACAIQSGFGVVYPSIIAPFAAFMFATRHFTYRLPSITEEPMAVLKLWRKMTNQISGKLALGLAFHVAVASIITFKEMQSFYTIQNKLIELEEKLENSA